MEKNMFITQIFSPFKKADQLLLTTRRVLTPRTASLNTLFQY